VTFSFFCVVFSTQTHQMKPFFSLATALLLSSLSFSQSEPEQLKVFIDCQYCDQNFIKQEVTYLTYVRDRLLADVHIQILSQDTGSGGELFTLFLYGQHQFEGNDDTLTVTTDANNTSDEIRRKNTKMLQLGLVKYMIKAGYGDQITLNVLTPESGSVEVTDPWNYWVFSLNASGRTNGEEQFNSINLNGGLSIDRVTEAWKIENSLWLNYNRGEYYIDEDTIVSERQSLWAESMVVKSITDHISVGISATAFSSIYDNYKINATLAPAFEYNIFPYEESTKRQIRITYKVGARHNEYNEETIYNRLDETLLFENLGISAKFQEQWGSVSARVNGSHYFHNFAINQLNFRLDLNLRLFKGFSWRISGNLSLIHDQISLPIGDASEEDVLLSQRQLQTGYRYWGSTGINYTFGSIYNSVVNPRFGG
jgi:hypothetical protein